MEKILATSVMIGNKAVLVQGKSGVGKSLLAMRLIEVYGAKLISDDVTFVCERQGKVYAFPADTIKGKIEVRGVGIVHMPCVENIEVACVVFLQDQKSERMPSDQTMSVLGCEIPLFTFDSNFVYNDIQVMAVMRYLQQKDSGC